MSYPEPLTFQLPGETSIDPPAGHGSPISIYQRRHVLSAYYVTKRTQRDEYSYSPIDPAAPKENSPAAKMEARAVRGVILVYSEMRDL